MAGVLLVAHCIVLPPGVHAQLAVSSNDNKVLNIEGVNTVVRNPAPDTVTIIDLGVSPPKVIGEVMAPGSWASPPQSVAVSAAVSITRSLPPLAYT